jgi:hypothetical protein
MDRRKMDKSNLQKQYYDDLKKGIEDKKRNNNLEQMMHANDTFIMHNK